MNKLSKAGMAKAAGGETMDELTALNVLELVRDTASAEWQGEDGELHFAVGNDGKRFWFITDNIMQEICSILAAQAAKKQPEQPGTFHQSGDCVVCAAPVPAWQDIATAPKDGTTLLGWVVAPPADYSDGFEAASLIYWDQGFAHSFGRRAPGWIKQWRGEVTHWMALPPTPGSQADNASPRSDHPLRAALQAPGCERLLDFYSTGPVQRAAVEAFAGALIDGVPVAEKARRHVQEVFRQNAPDGVNASDQGCAAHGLAHPCEACAMEASCEEVQADHRRLVRELDVLLNGETGAAKQASLCDIVAQVRREGVRTSGVRVDAIEAERRREIREGWKSIAADHDGVSVVDTSGVDQAEQLPAAPPSKGEQQ